MSQDCRWKLFLRRTLALYAARIEEGCDSISGAVDGAMMPASPVMDLVWDEGDDAAVDAVSPAPPGENGEGEDVLDTDDSVRPSR